MLYECKICNISTKIKTNYVAHCESAKHKKNEIEVAKCACEYCKKEFSCKKYLNAHLKLCSLKTNISIYKEQYIEEKNEQINKLTKELKKCEKEKNEIICKYKNKLKKYKNQENDNNVNILEYANTYLKEIPNLKKFNSFVHKEYEGINLCKNIIKKYDNITNLIGDLIINIYKTKLPQSEACFKQEIWAINNNTFICKIDNIWTENNGEIIINNIIKPMILCIQNLYAQYLTDCAKNFQLDIEIDNLFFFRKMEIIDFQKIINYIRPSFMINPLLLIKV